MEEQGGGRKRKGLDGPRTIHSFGALAIQNADKRELNDDEHLVMVIKKHPLGIVGIYLELAVGIGAIVAMVMLGIFSFFADGTHWSKSLIVVGSIFVIAALVFFMILIAVVYRKSQLLVTDKGVVQIIQRAPFNRAISRLSMANVEDVNVEQKGILASMFNYGTLVIQTAGREDNFIFSMCPNPDYYANQIIDTRQQYVRIYGEGHKDSSRLTVSSKAD